MAVADSWQYQYHVIPSDSEDSKTIEEIILSGDLVPKNWVLMAPASARRVAEHMQKLLVGSAEEQQKLIGTEIVLSEDGHSWFKFAILETDPSLTIRYRAKHSGVQIIVKRVYQMSVDTELINGKNAEPQMKLTAALAGNLLGNVPFGWKDRWCDVLDECKAAAGKFVGSLTGPEERAIRILHDGQATETYKRIVTPAHKWLGLIGKEVPTGAVLKHSQRLLKPEPKSKSKAKGKPAKTVQSSSQGGARHAGKKVLKKPAKK